MEKVVIVDAIRTPMGRSKGGAFRNVRAEDLSAHLMRDLLARNPALDAAALDDILLGLRAADAGAGLQHRPQRRAAGGDPAFACRPSPSTACAAHQCRRCTTRRA